MHSDLLLQVETLLPQKTLTTAHECASSDYKTSSVCVSSADRESDSSCS